MRSRTNTLIPRRRKPPRRCVKKTSVWSRRWVQVHVCMHTFMYIDACMHVSMFSWMSRVCLCTHQPNEEQRPTITLSMYGFVCMHERPQWCVHAYICRCCRAVNTHNHSRPPQYTQRHRHAPHTRAHTTQTGTRATRRRGARARGKGNKPQAPQSIH